MNDYLDEKLNFYGYCASNSILKKIYKNEELDSSDIEIISILLEEYRELLYNAKEFNIIKKEKNQCNVE